MARIRIRDGQTVTTETTVALGDRLIIEANAAILRSGAVPAVRVTGADAYVLNQGTIGVTGASGAAITGALSGVLDVRIVNQGTISGQSGAVTFSSSNGTTGSFQLDNAGTINGGASQAIAMRDLRATTITINNTGMITNNGSADVVRPGHDLASAIRIYNSGTILAADAAGVSENGDGIDFQPQDGGVLGLVVNRATGHIEGGKHGITGANEAKIVNEAGGVIIGRNGSGINYDTEAADGDSAVIVVNHGTISGRYDGLGDGDGDGVDVDYLVNVRNYGTIEGVGADNVENFADGIAAGGGVIINESAGVIYGETNGILIDDGDRNGAYAATRIVNAGLIRGEFGHGIQLIGDFDDTITNTGVIRSDGADAIDTGAGDDRVINNGLVTGVVALGDGDDLYNGTGSFTGLGGHQISGGDGNDVIIAGNGGDRINGGAGMDRIWAGNGADTFVYEHISQSGPALAAADRIFGFALGDTIELAVIDANETVDGDQAFTFIGQAAFSGVAGELNAVVENGNTLVSADVNGDGQADFSILLNGVTDPNIIAFNL